MILSKKQSEISSQHYALKFMVKFINLYLPTFISNPFVFNFKSISSSTMGLNPLLNYFEPKQNDSASKQNGFALEQNDSSTRFKRPSTSFNDSNLCFYDLLKKTNFLNSSLRSSSISFSNLNSSCGYISTSFNSPSTSFNHSSTSFSHSILGFKSLSTSVNDSKLVKNKFNSLINKPLSNFGTLTKVILTLEIY